MAAAMTYSSLVTDLEAYLQRYDATVINQIPRFVMLAQFRIPRELKILGFREEVTGVFDGTTQTTGIMQKPSDWRKTIAFYVGTGTDNNIHTPIYERAYEYCRLIYPDPTQSGTPRFYSDAAYNYWLLSPPPSSALPFKIAYYQTPVLLDNDTQQNWLTNYAPDLLLYGCLMEAVPFVKADERIPIWQGAFDRAKMALQAQEMEGRFDTQAIVSEPQNASTYPR